MLELLDLDATAPDRFEAITPAEGPPRLFGGQVAAQSLRATTLTVPDDRTVHSLHSYFIRPGRPGVPLELRVERIRDGRSFATRRVTAVQGDEAIFVLDASFHVHEDGHDWSEPLAPGVPGPDELPPRELFGRRPPWAPKDADGKAPRFRGPRAASLFELRPVNMGEDFSLHPAWVRLAEPIPDDPALHACALTYVSDMAVVRAAVAPDASPTWGGASLDHAVWFHRPLRVDEWLLFSASPLTNHGARGLARGSFHAADGTLVASFVQECLLRSTGMPPPP
ncbi:acyl-CoA thioesterase [Actinomarinicola tropica]|uniref:acyl-CoA thioesterase n=1 Tax=Actinomarinicola tropica TaxID=2789776 RepID=UPI0038991884